MKLSRIAFVAVFAAILSGCGKAPKAPQNTVAAVYIDLAKASDNIEDVVKDVASALPSSQKALRDMIREQLAESKKTAKEQAVAIDSLKWAMVTVVVDPKGIPVPQVGGAVYVSDADTLKEKVFKGATATRKIGETEVYRNPFAGGQLAFVGKVIVFSDSSDALDSLVRLYNGDEKPQPGFGDIDDLEGNTVARAIVPKVGELVERFGLDGQVLALAETTGDKDLVETVTKLGDIVLDVNLDDDEFGAKLSVTAGSRRDAKMIEALFTLASFGARFGADAGMAFLESTLPAKEFETAKSIRKLIDDDTIEADRSGKTATLTITFDTDDVIDAAVEAYFGK